VNGVSKTMNGVVFQVLVMVQMLLAGPSQVEYKFMKYYFLKLVFLKIIYKYK